MDLKHSTSRENYEKQREILREINARKEKTLPAKLFPSPTPREKQNEVISEHMGLRRSLESFWINKIAFYQNLLGVNSSIKNNLIGVSESALGELEMLEEGELDLRRYFFPNISPQKGRQYMNNVNYTYARVYEEIHEALEFDIFQLKILGALGEPLTPLLAPQFLQSKKLDETILDDLGRLHELRNSYEI